MMRRSYPALILAGLAGPALAATSALPLDRGTYVQADTPCKDAPFAAMRSWDGVGLGDPHSHGCRVRVLARSGATYRIANDCIDAGVGPAPRSTERMTLKITAHDRFLFDGTAFRRCPHGTN